MRHQKRDTLGTVEPPQCRRVAQGIRGLRLASKLKVDEFRPIKNSKYQDRRHQSVIGWPSNKTGHRHTLLSIALTAKQGLLEVQYNEGANDYDAIEKSKARDSLVYLTPARPHMTQNEDGIRQVPGTKEDPANAHQEKRARDPHRFDGRLAPGKAAPPQKTFSPFFGQLPQDQIGAIQPAPHDEGPVCAVP